jgi:hypothetical protein
MAPRSKILNRRMIVSVAGASLEQIGKGLPTYMKNLRFAAIVALTRTAKEIKQRHPDEMRRVFDNPTPWTLRSVFMQPATRKRNFAKVWLKDKGSAGKGVPAREYLYAEIMGGQRGPKPSEKALYKRGFLRRGEYLVPAKVRLNDYGNVTGGMMQKILADLGGFTDAWMNRPGTRARMEEEIRLNGRVVSQGRKGKYFIATIGKTKAIWERQKRGVKPMFLIVNKTIYRPRYDFVGFSNQVFKEQFSGQFRTALEQYGKGMPRKSRSRR